MNNVLQLEENLRPLTASEQMEVNGGVVPFLVAAAAGGSVIGIYSGLLAIAYYGGYGAHVIYDEITKLTYSSHNH